MSTTPNPATPGGTVAMTPDELLPCPFCGEIPDVDCSEDHSEAGQDTWLVCCGTGWCYGNAFTLDNSFYTRKHACESWNTRTTPRPGSDANKEG